MPRSKIRRNQITQITKSATLVSPTNLTPNVDAQDWIAITALANALTVNAPVGTLFEGLGLSIAIAATGANRVVTFNSIYRVPVSSSLTNSVTVLAGTETVFSFRYRAANNTMRFVAAVPEYTT